MAVYDKQFGDLRAAMAVGSVTNMSELLCSIFLVAFFIFNSILVLVLLGQGVRRALQRRLKPPRKVRAPERLSALSLSPQAPRN